MTTIQASGQTVLIDDEDLAKVCTQNWYLTPKGYVIGGRSRRLIHTVITERKFVDHKDGNKLNNQKSNLRVANPSQNQANKGVNKNNTSGYKGVTYHVKNQKYIAQIRHKKLIYLGSFSSSKEAALAYNAKAIELFGEFAYLNNVTDAGKI